MASIKIGRGPKTVLKASVLQLLADCDETCPDSAIRKQVGAKGESNWANLEWNDVTALERELLARYALPRLRREAHRLRSDYKETASAARWSDYEESAPPDPNLQPEPGEEKAYEEALRADCLTLHQDLWWLYSSIPVYENTRRTVLLVIAGVLMLAVGIATYLIKREIDMSVPIDEMKFPFACVILFSGAFGGLVSLWRRLYQAPLNGGLLTEVALSGRGTLILYLSPVMGAVGAEIFYLLLASGLVSGELFPRLYVPPIQGEGVTTPGPFLLFARTMSPYAGIDYAKLIIWCFIAGFSERLWIDLIDRLIAQAKE